MLKRLDGIDVKALSPEDQINYAVYRTQIGNLVGGGRNLWLEGGFARIRLDQLDVDVEMRLDRTKLNPDLRLAGVMTRGAGLS